MPGNIIVSSSVVDRVKNGKEGTFGALFGNINDDQYILGLFVDDQYSKVELMMPADVDLCGAFQIGDLKIDKVNEILQDVDVTDNPILLSIPEPCTILAYHVINNKLVQVPLVIVNEQEIYSQFIHVRLTTTIPFISDLEVDAVQEELLRIRKQFSSGKIAFNCPKENVFLLGTGDKKVCGSNNVINEDTTIGELGEKSGGPTQEGSYSRGSRDDMVTLPFSVYKKATFQNDETEILHAPVIQLEKCEVRVLQMLLKMDAMSLVHKNTKLSKVYTILVDSACRNLRLIGNYLIDSVNDYDYDFPLSLNTEVAHFYSSKYGHFISRIFDKTSEDDDNARLRLHDGLLLLKHKPHFKRCSRYYFKEDGPTENVEKAYIRNPHEHAKPSNNGGEQALVDGDYLYYHYCQDGINDDGWGCAYRSLQTIASWLQLQGFSNRDVPTHREIQQCLFDIGDKPSNIVGSRQWIGSTEVNYVLDSLYGITSKIIFVSSGEELATKGPELVYHFKKYGSPIMIGGGSLAHTILGVDYNRNTAELKFLILDPHYTGKEDIKTIVNKGWCAWKNANFWDKKSYYNMCLPITDNCI